jgi:hypothetical protein
MIASVAHSPQGRPRSVQSVRGLLLSLLTLALGVLLVGGLAGQCSFSPGGPDAGDATVPTVDADAELRRMARAVSFPVRAPRLPPGWRSTSADVDRVGQGRGAPAAVRVGWLTPGDGYLRLSQSSATVADLVGFETGSRAPATGTVRAGDREWTVYAGQRGEPAWVLDLGTVRLLLTGSAAEPELRTLATATLTAPTTPD